MSDQVLITTELGELAVQVVDVDGSQVLALQALAGGAGRHLELTSPEVDELRAAHPEVDGLLAGVAEPHAVEPAPAVDGAAPWGWGGA